MYSFPDFIVDVAAHHEGDKAIKVSVLEGDLAMLSALGFPLSLCIQLQLSCLKIDEAMWTAKSTPGGSLLACPCP